MEAFTRFDRFVSSELGGMMCQEGMHKRGPDIYNACSELRTPMRAPLVAASGIRCLLELPCKPSQPACGPLVIWRAGCNSEQIVIIFTTHGLYVYCTRSGGIMRVGGV
eukprot:744336-Prorocentrum_minimum.AAC.4